MQSSGRWIARVCNVMCMPQQPAERFALLFLLSFDGLLVNATIRSHLL
jgi:hypothetical protein